MRHVKRRHRIALAAARSACEDARMDPLYSNDPINPAADPLNPMNSAVGTVSKEQRTWAMGAHLSALLGFVIPLGNIIAPLVMWAWKKDDMPFVAEQAREALNFQISVTIYSLIAFFLFFAFIGVILLPAIILAALILTVIAGMKANDGVLYRYPLTIRLVK
jgi:uncharacterized Tic20 family protein